MKVSIICLVYKSFKLFNAMYDSLVRYTPMLTSNQAELIVVANDPSDLVLEGLSSMKIDYVLNFNERKTEDELFNNGYARPEYISRVYRGYNKGILSSKGDLIVLINSDHFFSEDWLENLLKFHTYDSVVSSQCVEPLSALNMPEAIIAEFGSDLDSFDDDNFQNYVKKIKKTGIYKGGEYMPALMHKDIALYVGLFPEGNISNGKNYNDILKTGDETLFYKLNKNRVLHYTSQDSIVYHLKEGEFRDNTPFYFNISLSSKINNDMMYDNSFFDFITSNGPEYDFGKRELIYKLLKSKPVDNRPWYKIIASKYLPKEIKQFLRKIFYKRTKF